MRTLIEQYQEVLERVRQAAIKANRHPDEVKLVPVSKFNPVEKIETLLEIGVAAFAESKVQELQEKQPVLPPHVEWHLIGHLQRNKVKYVVRMPNCRLIHSVDSFRLAEEIQRQCEKEERVMEILIQVNVANDDAKFGVPVGEALAMVKDIATLERVKVKGLMTIVPEADDPEETRPHFRRLRQLAEEIRTVGIPGVEMQELSMGMTGDFPVAIEEGATLVRVGSAIFGARDYENIK